MTKLKVIKGHVSHKGLLLSAGDVFETDSPDFFINAGIAVAAGGKTPAVAAVSVDKSVETVDKPKRSSRKK